MNKRVKIVVKGILVCLVFLAVVLVADKEISANRISDLEASIQEKEAEIDAAEKEKKELTAGLTNVEKVKKELEKSKANLTAYVQELDQTVTDIQQSRMRLTSMRQCRIVYRVFMSKAMLIIWKCYQNPEVLRTF